jgi:salicylate hydroxylase
MHRADLLDIFANVIPPGAIRTGHRCIGFEQDARAAYVKFDNGNSEEADVVIACDGIHSTLQKSWSSRRRRNIRARVPIAV